MTQIRRIYTDFLNLKEHGAGTKEAKMELIIASFVHLRRIFSE